MKKGAPFPPYLGGDDYLFISYAHKDSEQVYPIITKLHEQKYRVWYDEGIEIGVNWPMVVAEKLLHSRIVLVFLSKHAAGSQNCMREINYAVSQRKTMIVIELDESGIPAGMELQLETVPRIRVLDAEQAVSELLAMLPDSLLGDGVTGYSAAATKKRSSFSVWKLLTVVFMLLFAAAVGFLVYRLKNPPAGTQPASQKIISTEINPEVTVSTFSDASTLMIALKSSEERYLFLCGNCMVSDASAIVRKNGEWRIGSEVIPKGGIETFSFLEGKPVEQLALVNEKITGTDTVAGLTGLTYLDISGNPVSDLSGIAGLAKLETLRIVGISPDADLSVLAGMPSLKKIYISYDLAASAKPLVDAGIEVVIKE